MSSTTTPNFGLFLPTPGTDETFRISDINNNWTLIDTLARAVSCTSSTQPSTPFAGMLIWETDTLKLRRRNDANSTWTTVACLAITATNASPPTSPTAGQFYFESDTGALVVRNNGATWQHTGIPAVSATGQIGAPRTGQVVLLTTDNSLLRYNGSTWTPLVRSQYYTSRLGTTTTVTNAWTPIPFATADEGSLAGVSTSDNITFTFDEPGIWSVKATLIQDDNVSFIGCLLRGSNNDPFNAANQNVYSMQSANVIQTVAAVTLAADIRVATASSRSVRCLAIALSGSFILSSSGPVRPRISFKWSTL